MKKSLVNKCSTIADHYGPATQEAQAVSELTELSYVLTRRMAQRKSTWKADLLDEMADVSIMIQQLRLLYNVSDEAFEEKVKEKLDRQLERIKNGE